MSDERRHISDEEILRLMDGELSARRVREVQGHLSDCAECRDRHRAMKRTSEVIAELCDPELPVSDAGRIKFRVRLRERLREHRRRPLRAWTLKSRLSVRIALAAAAVIVVFAVLLGGKERMRQFKGFAAIAPVDFLIPNRSLTPGAVRPVTLAEVCSAHDDLDPTVSPSEEKAVFHEYGLHPGKRSRDYQIDYLVNPQLGGTNDLKNLWPQSYSDSRWNAHAKDELERRLNQMVCDGTVNLAVAQHAIQTNWIAAYKKYIGDQPS